MSWHIETDEEREAREHRVNDELLKGISSFQDYGAGPWRVDAPLDWINKRVEKELEKMDQEGSTRSPKSIRDNINTPWDQETAPEEAMGYQVGGDHYRNKKFQPIEYILANDLDFCEGCVIKYVTRWKERDGVSDLKKARHYLEFLIEEQEKRLKES